MIKQKSVVIKTALATLTYTEMGDIVCNSATDITITLPTPNSGLWYRISNVGVGIVTVYYGSALTTLKQTEQCLCLANTTTAWFFSKGGGVMTKAEIEDVLTGEISSHNHAAVYELPAGGSIGQILEKNSITDRDVIWKTLSENAVSIQSIPVAVPSIATTIPQYDGTSIDWIPTPIMSGDASSIGGVPVGALEAIDGYVLTYDSASGTLLLKSKL